MNGTPQTIRKMRRDRNWSQKHLGDLVGVGRVTVIAHEKGHTVPSLQVLDRYAEIFGVGRDDIDLAPRAPKGEAA